MSPRGHEAALKLNLGPRELELIAKALEPNSGMALAMQLAAPAALLVKRLATANAWARRHAT